MQSVKKVSINTEKNTKQTQRMKSKKVPKGKKLLKRKGTTARGKKKKTRAVKGSKGKLRSRRKTDKGKLKKRKKGKRKGSLRGKKKNSMVELGPPLPEFTPETVYEALHEVTEADSPIDLIPNPLKKIKMRHIQWSFMEEVPLTMQLYNTKYNVILTGTWPEKRTPAVTDGPFVTNYEFSQIHFHWGVSNDEGSEHTVQGVSYPFEMHAVFYKSAAESITRAKEEEDGILIFVFLFQVQPTDSPALSHITSKLAEVYTADTTAQIQPVPLVSLMSPIVSDYIMYNGQMEWKCKYPVTYVISRDVKGISDAQLNLFRNMKDRFHNPMSRTFRTPQPLKNRNIFIVNPAGGFNDNQVLRPIHLVSLETKSSSKSSKKRRRSKKRKRTKKGLKTVKKSPVKGKAKLRKGNKRVKGKKKKSNKGSNNRRTPYAEQFKKKVEKKWKKR